MTAPAADRTVPAADQAAADPAAPAPAADQAAPAPAADQAAPVPAADQAAADQAAADQAAPAAAADQAVPAAGVPARSSTLSRPLDDQMAACLAELGLGAPVGDGSVPSGRNQNWAGSTSNGLRVFVKRLRGSPRDVTARLRRTVAFADAMQSAELPSPRSLGACDEHLVLVTELLDEAVSGADLAQDGTFDCAVAATAGEIVATLHSSPPGAASDTSRPPLPDPGFLSAIPLTTYLELSNAELTFWRLVQSDPTIAGSVSRLLADSDRAPHVPAHCDLRLDQFLRSGDRLLLTDGEEFRVADPARDVGSFAGEWLFRSVAGLVTDPELALAEPATDDAQIIGTAVRRLAERRPIVESFWNAYADARDPGPDLAVRATAFAGWHLLDRAAAGASRSARLAAPLRAAMGVGRQALATPERFAATLGLA
jgi:hypothetical protein